LLVVTDPPDPLAELARRIAGHDRVLSSGTFLDTLRFRFHLGRALGVDPKSVDALVLGEHGTSQVHAWSLARIGGTPIAAFGLPQGMQAEAFRRRVEDEVRYANINIIEGTGASQLGIGTVVARIAEMVDRDEQAVVPVGSHRDDFGVTLSLPSQIGRGGVSRVWMPPLAPDEMRALEQSARALRDALQSVEPG